MISRRRFALALPLPLLLVAAVTLAQLGGVSTKRSNVVSTGKASLLVVRKGEVPLAVARVHVRGATGRTTGRVNCSMSEAGQIVTARSRRFTSRTRWPMPIRMRAPRADTKQAFKVACIVVVHRGSAAALRARTSYSYPNKRLPSAPPQADRVAERWYEVPEGHVPTSTSTVRLQGLTPDSEGVVICTMSGGGTDYSDSVDFAYEDGREPISIELEGTRLVGPMQVLVTCDVSADTATADFHATGTTEFTSTSSTASSPSTNPAPGTNTGSPSPPAATAQPGTLRADGTREPGRRDNGDGTFTLVTMPMTAVEATRERLVTGSRFHEAPDGRIQVIHGSTQLPTGVGTLQPDGTRVVGVRTNADGSITVVYPKIPSSQKSAVTLGSRDRFHDVPGGRYAQLIRGSTIM